MNSLQGVWGPPNVLWDPPRGEFRPLKVCPELQSSIRGRPPPPQAQLRGFSLLPKKKPHKKPPPKPKPTPKKNPNPRREISSSFCFFHPIKKGGGGGVAVRHPAGAPTAGAMEGGGGGGSMGSSPNPPGEDNAHEDGESTSTAPRGHLVCTCTESTDRAGGEQQHGDAGMHRCTPRQPLLGGGRGGGGVLF